MSFLSGIENIIFDFGGVVYDVRYENMAEELARRGVDNPDGFYGRTHQTNEMDLFEMGLITPEEFREYVRSATHKPFSDQDVDDILNSMLLGLPSARVDLLRAIKKQYRTFLFSNTNAIHYAYFYNDMLKGEGCDILEECFEACYYSHLMHKRKPSADGFRQIVAEQGLEAERTLFIDDNAPNLAGAAEVGLKTYHLTGDLSDLFGAEGRLMK